MATGDKDWTAGAVVTAADMDDYLQLQVVGQYASASARDTALSSRKREGMFAYLLDTNTLTVYTGSTWSTIGTVHGALTSWTPVVVQSNTPTLTVAKASYSQVGRSVTGWFIVTVTSAGTSSNLVTISLPVAAAAAYVSDYGVIGNASLADASATAIYQGQMVLASTTTMKIRTTTGTTPPTFLGTTIFTAALANGDIICGNFSYEAGADA